ncbi:MAG: UDP-N-acetylglucosamine 4,6-dehydratase (inverting) [Deltaproteobacteria bacterium]|nr:UDP-N-acetylglucosamine 4,6-dehydratase (inverting) [Deltaproteobacteria bacterium]
MDFHNKTILITGGTGSFGQQCIEILLEEYHPRKIIVFSRDELKQSQMQERFRSPSMRYFIGDVRDKERLQRAMTGVDLVIHCAALKQVPALEYNPFEAIRTNIIGGYNVISAAIDAGVEKVVALSTDKAANPINLYGATKLCSDKLFIASNSLVGEGKTRAAVVRYGNVVGSRGSVVPLFLRQRATGKISITDERMTRFIITLEQGVRFVLRCFDMMAGGELFVPKLPSVRMTDVAEALAPGCTREIVGIRPGEKMHEVMVPVDDARHTMEFNDFFVITPQFHWWRDHYQHAVKGNGARPCPDGFCYASDTNAWWLSPEEIRELVAKTHIDPSLLAVR